MKQRILNRLPHKRAKEPPGIRPETMDEVELHRHVFHALKERGMAVPYEAQQSLVRDVLGIYRERVKRLDEDYKFLTDRIKTRDEKFRQEYATMKANIKSNLMTKLNKYLDIEKQSGKWRLK